MKIYNTILKAYLPYRIGKAKNKIALSPLDLPMKTVARVLLLSLVLTLFIGFTLIFCLRFATSRQLINESKTRIVLDKKQEKNNATSKQVLYYLFGPQLLSRNEAAEDEITQKLEKAFKGKDITYNSFIVFLKSNGATNTEELDNLIIGSLGFFAYAPKSANEIADRLGMAIDFTKSGIEQDKLKRDITISIILKFRDQLKADVLKPLRLLIALDGRIQWFTFFAFIFCSLLLTLRLYWAKMQLKLIVQPSPKDEEVEEIEWLPGYKNNLFKITGGQESLVKLRNGYKNLFIAQRYIDEVQDALEQDVIQEKSLYDTIQQRINWLKQAVNDGEYLIIDFFLWLIPSLGFIGTIIGIISAMEASSGIFEATDALGQIIALQKVAVGLGTAFDTTYVSLVLICVLMLYNAVVQKTENLIFVRLDRVSLDYFVYELKYFSKRKNSSI